MFKSISYDEFKKLFKELPDDYFKKLSKELDELNNKSANLKGADLQWVDLTECRDIKNSDNSCSVINNETDKIK